MISRIFRSPAVLAFTSVFFFVAGLPVTGFADPIEMSPDSVGYPGSAGQTVGVSLEEGDSGPPAVLRYRLVVSSPSQATTNIEFHYDLDVTAIQFLSATGSVTTQSTQLISPAIGPDYGRANFVCTDFPPQSCDVELQITVSGTPTSGRIDAVPGSFSGTTPVSYSTGSPPTVPIASSAGRLLVGVASIALGARAARRRLPQRA